MIIKHVPVNQNRRHKQDKKRGTSEKKTEAQARYRPPRASKNGLYKMSEHKPIFWAKPCPAQNDGLCGARHPFCAGNFKGDLVHIIIHFFFTPVPTWARHCFGVQARLDSTRLRRQIFISGKYHHQMSAAPYRLSGFFFQVLLDVRDMHIKRKTYIYHFTFWDDLICYTVETMQAALSLGGKSQERKPICASWLVAITSQHLQQRD